jgi:tRNA uridine 5-carboxymethylaminomethyl modification enzyme
MFTSRAEFRLLLRCDNADRRLTPIGLQAGCVGRERAEAFDRRMRSHDEITSVLKARELAPEKALEFSLQLNRDGVRRSAFTVLSYPNIAFADLVKVWPELEGYPKKICAEVENDAKYSVYVELQAQTVLAIRRDGSIKLGDGVNYDEVVGLANEDRIKLKAAQTESLGQAARIEGVTPAALALLLAWTKKKEMMAIAGAQC